MLLKAGMTIKQAYLCNLLSACLQMIGVIIGVAMGNVAMASQWLFAFAGGIFLYVGLVDMVSQRYNYQECFRKILIVALY